MPKAPVDHISAPPFPRDLPWFNVAPLRIDQQQGRPLLIEFWDLCRPNSIRTLPYMRAWHARYAGAGLRVIGVHSPGFEVSDDADEVERAVARLGIEYPVVVDLGHQIWQEYENRGWPARYLFGPELTLVYYHFGEGAYLETELMIQELLGLGGPSDRDPGDPGDLGPGAPEPLAPLRPEDEPDAEVIVPTPASEVGGAYSGPYAAGGVWGVFAGTGIATVNGVPQAIDHPGAHELIAHHRHTEGVLDLSVSDDLTCLAVCFTPGVAAPGAAG